MFFRVDGADLSEGTIRCPNCEEKVAVTRYPATIRAECSCRALTEVHEKKAVPIKFGAIQEAAKNAGVEAAIDQPNLDLIANSIGMKLIKIPPGTFTMGSPDDRTGLAQQFKVTLTKGFYLAIHPVTQACWRDVMGNNPSYFKGDDLPVECVSWMDCQDFLKKLRDRDGHLYRLPTEAEWEYSCRAGTTTLYSFGNGITARQANFGGGPSGKTTPVGSYPANAWGLFDMHGNVWEWCEDWYGMYPKRVAIDHAGVVEGSRRIIRGGSYHDRPSELRSDNRWSQEPGSQGRIIGFRVAMFLPPQPAQQIDPPQQLAGIKPSAGAVPITRHAATDPLGGATNTKFTCSSCQEKLQAKSIFCGKRVKCPKCGQTTAVPDSDEKKAK